MRNRVLAARRRAFVVVVVVVVVVGVVAAAGCTDLSLHGDEQLSCATNTDCPAHLLCAKALGRCVDENIVAAAPIAVDGEATVDAPRISRVEGFARAVVTTTFTRAPAQPATALVDNRLAIACEADGGDAGADKTWLCTFDARDFPDEPDGAYDIIVVGTDGAGNEARARARVELDTAAPAIAPDSVAVVYSLVDDAIVRDVAALGPATAVTVQLSLTEATAATPVLAMGGAAAAGGGAPVTLLHDDARSVGPLHVFALAGTSAAGTGAAAGLLADGAYPLTLDVVDDVGNQASLDVGAAVDVDSTAPAAPAVDAADGVVYSRVPFGTRSDPAPHFDVAGATGAAEPGTTAIVTSEESIASTLLGTAPVGDDGAFAAGLEVIDVPRVYVRLVDAAGNIGPAARVHDVSWTASLGGRRRSDSFSNPHALFAPASFDAEVLAPNLVDEPLRAGDLVDAAALQVQAVPHRRDVRTDATGQPKRMSHAAAYLPTIGAPVLFGGVPDRNRTQTSTTFVLRNEHWVPVIDNPPVNGALAYDTAHRELVALLVNGDTWGFDGTAWRQRPVATIPTMQRGPVAWDPIAERLVTVQGTETWVLTGDDEAWTQLAGSDAPIAGLAIFNGLDTPAPGAVIAFDGVDGVVLLYGNEAGGGGAVYALVDDVWTRLGDAPPTSAATAVEDLDTGRVHFVCRTVGNSTDGTMLTWDGAAMQAGPVNTEPNSGCAATYDLARHRVLIHGGTGDNLPNVQALPQTSTAILDDGSSTWRVDLTGAAPPTINHNGGGTSHFNPVLNRVMLYGAATSANLARVTTLLDGVSVVPANNGSSPFGLPFFDGVRSRFIDFSAERFFDGATSAWVARTTPFQISGTPSYTYDADADTAFAYNGNFDGTTNTFRLRGDVLTPLAPATSPPSRQSPTLAYDPVNHRVVLAGGNTNNNTGIVNDAWVFERGGDWRRIDDLPIDPARPADFQAVGRNQLVFDRERGVVVGLMDGVLYDLRGDSWVQRPIDVAPRANALFAYDEFNHDLLFVGGLEFELFVTTSTRVRIGDAAAAHVARFDLAATGAAGDAVLDDLRVAVVAGATGADANGAVDGVSLMMWGASQFIPLASNTAPAAAPAPLTVTRTGAELGLLGHVLGRPLFLALVSAPTGPGADDARLVTEQLEVVARYREP